jgi:putative transposase
MARLAGVIAVGIPHHITQRGNARRLILQDDADRKVYLDLLRQSTEQHGVHCQFGAPTSMQAKPSPN